jgi:hypothetical protein
MMLQNSMAIIGLSFIFFPPMRFFGTLRPEEEFCAEQEFARGGEGGVAGDAEWSLTDLRPAGTEPGAESSSYTSEHAFAN